MGLLYSVGPLISILSNLFWSMMSDRLGTVRKIMALLLGGQLVTAIILARAADFSSVMLILSVFYFFYYPVFPLADTMAIKIAPASRSELHCHPCIRLARVFILRPNDRLCAESTRS